MKAENISIGDVLELKRERQDAYGMDSPYVKVTAIRYKNGYKTPWVYTDKGEFRPSDFESISRQDLDAQRYRGLDNALRAFPRIGR